MTRPAARSPSPADLGRRGLSGALAWTAAGSGVFLVLTGVLRHGGIDFWVFWAAARAAAGGLDPYAPGALAHIALPPWMPWREGFFSPPFLLSWLLPLTRLPYVTAWHLWAALSVAAVGGLCVLLPRLAGVDGRRGAALCALGLCALTPLWNDLALGQTDVFIVLAVAVSWRCIEQGRGFWGGVVVAPGFVDPHLVTGVVLYYLVRVISRRDYALGAGLVAAAVVDVALTLLHPSLLHAWVTVGLPSAQQLAMGNALTHWRALGAAGTGWASGAPPLQLTWMHLVSAVVSRHWRWGPPVFSATAPQVDAVRPTAERFAAAAAAVIALASAAGAVWIWRESPSRSHAVEHAIAAVLTLVVTTFAYDQDYLLLVLAVPAVLEWERSTRGREARRTLMWTALGMAFGALALCCLLRSADMLALFLGSGIVLTILRRTGRIGIGGAVAAFIAVMATGTYAMLRYYMDALPTIACLLVATCVVGAALAWPLPQIPPPGSPTG